MGRTGIVGVGVGVLLGGVVGFAPAGGEGGGRRRGSGERWR